MDRSRILCRAKNLYRRLKTSSLDQTLIKTNFGRFLGGFEAGPLLQFCAICTPPRIQIAPLNFYPPLGPEDGLRVPGFYDSVINWVPGCWDWGSRTPLGPPVSSAPWHNQTLPPAWQFISLSLRGGLGLGRRGNPNIPTNCSFWSILIATSPKKRAPRNDDLNSI